MWAYENDPDRFMRECAPNSWQNVNAKQREGENNRGPENTEERPRRLRPQGFGDALWALRNVQCAQYFGYDSPEAASAEFADLDIELRDLGAITGEAQHGSIARASGVGTGRTIYLNSRVRWDFPVVQDVVLPNGGSATTNLVSDTTTFLRDNTGLNVSLNVRTFGAFILLHEFAHLRGNIHNFGRVNMNSEILNKCLPDAVK
jgi:hypothetical protein